MFFHLLLKRLKETRHTSSTHSCDELFDELKITNCSKYIAPELLYISVKKKK